MTTGEPVEHDYLVVVEHTFTYRVSAETPEDAAAVIDQGEYEYAQEQEVLFSTVERVVAGDGHYSDADLRGPTPCRGCGKPQAPGQAECTPCFLGRLDRLDRERAARAEAEQSRAGAR